MADFVAHRRLRTPAAADYLGYAGSTLEKKRLTGDGPPFINLGQGDRLRHARSRRIARRAPDHEHQRSRRFKLTAGTQAEAKRRIMTALDALAGERRWVAWRNELRGGKPTKMPYAPNGGKARADDPATWGTRAEAEATAKRIVNGQGGGIGFQLGDLGDDTHVAGIDLDSCIANDDKLAPWAAATLNATPTYTERSPSGRRLKLFSTSRARTCGRSSTASEYDTMPGALAVE